MCHDLVIAQALLMNTRTSAHRTNQHVWNKYSYLVCMARASARHFMGQDHTIPVDLIVAESLDALQGCNH
jgi:hypothetical protein